VQGGEVVIPLRDRVLGRVVIGDLLDPHTAAVLVPDGEMIDEQLMEIIEQRNVNEVLVRSAVTCETRRGVCSKCYGRDLGRGHLVDDGEAVGVIAAQSIGEPGTQLTMRTFHIGGAASRQAAANNIEVRNKGKVLLHNIRTIEGSSGDPVVLTRSGELIVQDEYDVDKERYKIPYGSILRVAENEKVDRGQIIAEWDPHTHPIITEVGGTVQFVDIQDDVTVELKEDPATMRETRVVFDAQNRRGTAAAMKPAILLVDEAGNEVTLPGTDRPALYTLPSRSVIQVEDGAAIAAGDVLAKIPQASSKTRDITGGLPRVAELFEARKPKDSAILAPLTGVVSFGQETKGKRRLVIIDADGEDHEYLISKERHINVYEGETIQQGEIIVDGPMESGELLKYRGVDALADYIVNEVQDVYRLQGVKINDKHIEVIIRQMLRKVTVMHPGDSRLLPGEQVAKIRVIEENEKLLAEKKEPVEWSPLLLGITKASLTTESFISAASFQETTRVLTEASINGKVDNLRGLKENVIVGRLIPAGTGQVYHQERHRATLEPTVSDVDTLLDGITGDVTEKALDEVSEPVSAVLFPGQNADDEDASNTNPVEE